MNRTTLPSPGARRVAIGVAHDALRELPPTPRGFAPQARAIGYVAPGLGAIFLRAMRRLLESKGPSL